MALVTQSTDFKVKSGIIMAGTATVTSSTGQTGTLQVAGGAAIAKNIIVGSTSDVYGSANFYSNLSVTGTSVLNPLIVNGVTTSTNTTTASTNAGGQGALVVAGGAYIGDNSIIMSTASSTSTGLSNALYVNGGAYVNNNFTVGGPALFKDTVLFSGTATYVYSTNTLYTDNLLELHVPPTGQGTNWTVDDGKDIGIRIHYYGSTGTSAAFVFANDSKKFEFYQSGAEGTSTFTSGVYGGIKAGNLQLVDTTAAANTYSGTLVVAGGIGLAGNVYSGQGLNAEIVTARNLTDTRLVVAGLNGQLYDYAGLTYNTGTNIIQGTITTASFANSANTANLATSATNVAGGSAGALVYQTAADTTNFVALGTSTYVLTSNGTAPYWAPTGGAVTASTATNLAGGNTGQIPFQSTPGITTFSSTLTYISGSGTLLVNGGSTSTGNVSASGNITSSSTVFTNYLRVLEIENSQNTTTGAMTVAGGVGIAQDLTVGGQITTGATTSNSTVSLLSGNNLNLSTFTKTGISGTGMVNLDMYSGSNYRASKYFIQVVDGSNVHVTEMSVFHDGVDAYKTEYGYHYNNGVLGTFGAMYTASNVLVTFLPVGATNMTIKIVRWSLTP